METSKKLSIKSSARRIRKKELSELKKPCQKIAFVVFLCAWVIFSITLSQLVIGYILILFLHNLFFQPLWTAVYYALTYLASLVLIILIPPKLPSIGTKIRAVIRRKRKSRDSKSPVSRTLEANLITSKIELGIGKWPTFTDICLAPIAYVAYIMLANFCTMIMKTFQWFNAEQAQETGFHYFFSSFDQFVAMLSLIIIAPVAEELIMRGWLYGKVRSKLKVLPAILIVSVVFGLLHGQWNIGVGVFAMSLVLCGLREITGTIWAGMFLHILSNGIAFYLVYILGM